MRAPSALALLSLVFTATTTMAENHNPQVSVNKDGVILNGYDAVAYFTENKAVKGKAKFNARHNGATYWFASEENRDTFAKNPGKYAPQYGGWCAYGLALGKKFPVDGKAFEVRNGKLYVNLDKSIQKKWAKDRDGYINDADKQWPVIKATPAKDLN